MASIQQVSKILKDAGWDKAEWQRKGVSTRNEGFMISKLARLTSDDKQSFSISYEFAGSYHDETTDERFTREQALNHMIAALQEAGISARVIAGVELWIEVR